VLFVVSLAFCCFNLFFVIFCCLCVLLFVVACFNVFDLFLNCPNNNKAHTKAVFQLLGQFKNRTNTLKQATTNSKTHKQQKITKNKLKQQNARETTNNTIF
jgi:hypothetical protein